MQVTRREFVIGSAAGLAAASLPFWLSGHAVAAAPATYTTTFSQLSRISFGATLADCTSLMQRGLSSYLDAQLAPTDSADSFCNAKLAAATLHIEYKAAEKPMDAKKDGKPPEPPKDTGVIAKLFGAEEKMPEMMRYGATNEDRPLSSLNKTAEQLWPLADNDHYVDYKERRRPADEVRAATWIRAVHSQFQLREVMVEFWHNHFNVNAFGDQKISAMFPL